MIDPPTSSSLMEKANAAFAQAAVKIIERARQTGTPVIIWENGQVREISPDEMQDREALTRKR
ncbi:MAG: hypothetical protein ACKVT0_05800 [Planctomycetaceae bacterium]